MSDKQSECEFNIASANLVNSSSSSYDNISQVKSYDKICQVDGNNSLSLYDNISQIERVDNICQVDGPTVVLVQRSVSIVMILTTRSIVSQ